MWVTAVAYLVAVYCVKASHDAHKGCELPVKMPLYGFHPLRSILCDRACMLIAAEIACAWVSVRAFVLR